MCEHDHIVGPTPKKQLERRHVLAGAAALAGLGVASFLPGSAIAAEPATAPAALPLAKPGNDSKVEPIIIQGGSVVDPETGHIIEDAVVVLAQGKVKAIGTRDETRKAVREVGSKASVVNAHGKFVLPGLVDAHVHAQSFEALH